MAVNVPPQAATAAGPAAAVWPLSAHAISPISPGHAAATSALLINKTITAHAATIRCNVFDVMFSSYSI